MSFKFVIYTVPDCSECQDAKDLIKSQGMTFGECSLETQEAVDEFHRRYGHTTVPQVYLATEKQEYIGDYADLEQFMLEVVNQRRVGTLISPTGIAAGSNTVHVRQGKDGSTTISKEEGVKEYNISITEKEKMKDITPYDT
tara:strand:+ start:891 stop:1313 length:423 start_codon:yes stop_codon:yes gene_type:complete